MLLLVLSLVLHPVLLLECPHTEYCEFKISGYMVVAVWFCL